MALAYIFHILSSDVNIMFVKSLPRLNLSSIIHVISLRCSHKLFQFVILLSCI